MPIDNIDIPDFDVPGMDGPIPYDDFPDPSGGDDIPLDTEEPEFPPEGMSYPDSVEQPDESDPEGIDEEIFKGGGNGSSRDDKDLIRDIEKFLDIGVKAVDKIVKVATGRPASDSPSKKAPSGRAYDDIPIPVPTTKKQPKALPPKQAGGTKTHSQDAGVLDAVERALEAQE